MPKISSSSLNDSPIHYYYYKKCLALRRRDLSKRAFFFVAHHQKKTKMTTTRKPSTAKHYVSSSGTTRSRKPLFRPTAIADVFWTLLDVLVAFFRTLLSLDHAQKYGTKAGDVNAPRGGGGGGRRGGGNNGTRRYGGSNIHGIDHNATPPSA